MKINTPVGPKDPQQALELFRLAIMSAGSLLGVYTQLIQHAPDEAAQATKFVNDNQTKYSEKIQRLAKKQQTGRPTGVERITSETQVLEILRNIGQRPTVKIVFRADRPNRVIAVALLHPDIVQFHEDGAATMLTYCVQASGNWENVPRTYVITINDLSANVLPRIAKSFGAALESIELMHNLSDRVEAQTAPGPLSSWL